MLCQQQSIESGEDANAGVGTRQDLPNNTIEAWASNSHVQNASKFNEPKPGPDCIKAANRFFVRRNQDQPRYGYNQPRPNLPQFRAPRWNYHAPGGNFVGNFYQPFVPDPPRSMSIGGGDYVAGDASELSDASGQTSNNTNPNCGGGMTNRANSYQYYQYQQPQSFMAYTPAFVPHPYANQSFGQPSPVDFYVLHHQNPQSQLPQYHAAHASMQFQNNPRQPVGNFRTQGHYNRHHIPESVATTESALPMAVTSRRPPSPPRTNTTPSASDNSHTPCEPGKEFQFSISKPPARKLSLPEYSISGPSLLTHKTRHAEFSKLKAEWQKTGVDSRCEALLDGIVQDVLWGKYPLPEAFTEKYELPKPSVIGSGANGRLFITKTKEDVKEVVVKFTLSMAGAFHEVSILKHCDSALIIKLLDHFYDCNISIAVVELSGTPWTPDNIQLNTFTHQNLARRPLPAGRRTNIRDLFACTFAHSSLPIATVRKVFGQITQAVRFLHCEAGVCHGDLKLQNVLVDENYCIKLVDMSAARFIKDGPIKHFLGTPMFGAPETRVGPFDGTKNDIWALGIILYMLIYGIDNEPRFVQKETQEVIVPKKNHLNKDVKDLIRKLLTHDASCRPTIEDVCGHPFLLESSGSVSDNTRSHANALKPHQSITECEMMEIDTTVTGDMLCSVSA